MAANVSRAVTNKIVVYLCCDPLSNLRADGASKSAEESRWCDNINFVDVIGDAAMQFGRNFNGELLRFKLLGLAFRAPWNVDPDRSSLDQCLGPSVVSSVFFKRLAGWAYSSQRSSSPVCERVVYSLA